MAGRESLNRFSKPPRATSHTKCSRSISAMTHARTNYISINEPYRIGSNYPCKFSEATIVESPKSAIVRIKGMQLKDRKKGKKKRGIAMKISDKLLVEQAWSLGANINRSMETERLRRSASYAPSVKVERLKSIHAAAYSRYLRRLKKYWT